MGQGTHYGPAVGRVVGLIGAQWLTVDRVLYLLKKAFENRGSVVDNTRWFVNSFLAVLGCDIDTIYLPSFTDAARRCVCVLLKFPKR